MAEPSPGQIITPGGGAPQPPQEPQQQAEVTVDISQAPHTNANIQPQAPTSQVPPNPQPAQVTQPAPPASATPLATTPLPAPSPSLEQPQEPAPQPELALPSGGFAPQFQINDAQPPENSSSSADSISWTASEYIAHQKSAEWYLILAAATIGFSVLIYLITGGDILSVVVIVLAAIVFGIYAGKRPKEQQYSVSSTGVSIGPKTYGFDQLRTFAVVDEGAFSSIVFMPMKRFMPALSIYYDPKDEENIVNVLSNYLPMDVQKRDVVDNLMRKIRF